MRRIQARLGAALLASTALAGIPPALAFETLPTGGSVVSGRVAISNPNARTLAIQQSTQNAIVNWQGFSIGQGDAVNIQQPSSSAAILNRVTSSTPSTIAGQLNANGQVYLVNPNGIAITKTGVVSAAGFVASTLGIGDDDFRNGKRTFNGNGASAGVSNAGTITIGRGGYAALIGGTVSNAGLISAPLGKVGLGSGEVATIDLSGDGFLQVAAPTKAGGKTALIQNAGTIKANGGRVVMTAATAREAARNAINISGIVQARNISGHSGAIILGGGAGGDVNVSGKLNVSGKGYAGGSIAVSGRTIAISGKLYASGARGGAIALAASGGAKVTGKLFAKGFAQTGGLVTITGNALEFAGAFVNVSGAKGGGAVNIGATKSVSLDAATTVTADATKNGDGGAIKVAALGAATVNGGFDARGGAAGGDGGNVETSGATVDFSGIKVDATAAHGAVGMWLVDPTNLTVNAAAAQTIDANLATSNVTLQTTASGASGPGLQTPGAGDITIAAALAWASPQSLTLDAYHGIAIDAPITISGAGKLNLSAAADPTIPQLPLLSFGSGASIQFTGTPNIGQALTINGQAYTLLYSMSDVLKVNNNLAGDYALAKPLDAAGTTYTKALIGTSNSRFAGAFEGLGNAISNLTINAPTADYVGLFGDVGAAGTIARLGLIGGGVTGNNFVGGLAGENDGMITQSYATGMVTGTAAVTGSSVGGLVGINGGTITQTYATGTVRGANSVGGLVGFNQNAITQSYATGAVSGSNEEFGGLVGNNSGTITKAYATGAVSGTVGAPAVGGLVGGNEGAITQSYATGAVTGLGNVGSLVGLNDEGAITQSYATGAVSGATGWFGVGGLVGGNLGAITLSYSTGAVNGGDNVGGFVGTNYAYATIMQSYATGAVRGENNVGGLVGYNGGATAQTYATGAVSGTTAVGGLLGVNAAGASVITSYWDKVTTGQTHGVGTNTGAFSATGLTTTQFSNIKNFVGWTFGTTPGGSGWVIVGAAGTLNNANGHAGATRPMLLSEYSTTIVNGHQLQLIVLDPTASYKLGDDIDLGPALTNPSEVWYTASNAPSYGSGFVPIGGWRPQFTGTFDGQNHTISNLIIDRPNNYNVALFGYVGAGGVIENVNLVGGSVTGYQRVGDLVGKNHGLVKNSSASGIIRGDDYVGGLVGWSLGTITRSHANGAVSGGDNVGGLVGASGQSGFGSARLIDDYATGAVFSYNLAGGLAGYNSGAITQSYATGSADSVIGADGGVGGLVGYNSGAITQSHATGRANEGTAGGLVGINAGAITQSFATDSVGTFDYAAGGLVGWNNGGTITHSYATGGSGGHGADVGGLVGRNSGQIAQSYATGSVYADGAEGGLVGSNSGTIAQSYATGNVTSDLGDEGGLVGYNSGTIAQSYATGNATSVSSNDVGGLVGFNSGSIKQSYATGAVFGFFNVGGLVGSNGGTVTTSYWDTITTGQAEGAGTNTGTFSATGLTTAQLKAGLPSGFDPAIWGIVPGVTYPYLKGVTPTP